MQAMPQEFFQIHLHCIRVHKCFLLLYCIPNFISCLLILFEQQQECIFLPGLLAIFLVIPMEATLQEELCLLTWVNRHAQSRSMLFGAVGSPPSMFILWYRVFVPQTFMKPVSSAWSVLPSTPCPFRKMFRRKGTDNAGQDAVNQPGCGQLASWSYKICASKPATHLKVREALEKFKHLVWLCCALWLPVALDLHSNLAPNTYWLQTLRMEGLPMWVFSYGLRIFKVWHLVH